MNYTKDSNLITRDFFDSILLESRYFDSVLPSTQCSFFGNQFETPITTAALSHLHDICENGMSEFALGAKKANALHFVGMGEDIELEQIVKTGAKTVKIIKPHQNDQVIFNKIEHAVNCGCVAVGMDIDHAFASNGKYDTVCSLPMQSKSSKQIAKFVEVAKIPFVIKGVLSVTDAKKSVDCGAKAIIVSHHHGIMNYAVPPLMILEKIVKEVSKDVLIFVDCGIESGYDAFKALALGANAVCVGRALMNPLKDKSDGVLKKITELNDELKSVMARCGASSLSKIDKSVLHFRNF